MEERGIEVLFKGKPELCHLLSFIARTGNTFLGCVLAGVWQPGRHATHVRQAAGRSSWQAGEGMLCSTGKGSAPDLIIETRLDMLCDGPLPCPMPPLAQLAAVGGLRAAVRDAEGQRPQGRPLSSPARRVAQHMLPAHCAVDLSMRAGCIALLVVGGLQRWRMPRVRVYVCVCFVTRLRAYAMLRSWMASGDIGRECMGTVGLHIGCGSPREKALERCMPQQR